MKGLIDVDVTDLAKSKRNPSQLEHHAESDSGNTKAAQKGGPHELWPQDEFPHYLQVKREGTDETCLSG